MTQIGFEFNRTEWGTQIFRRTHPYEVIYLSASLLARLPLVLAFANTNESSWDSNYFGKVLLQLRLTGDTKFSEDDFTFFSNDIFTKIEEIGTTPWYNDVIIPLDDEEDDFDFYA